MSDSSDEEHPFVKYGTPLPDIDESSVKASNFKSSVPVFDQIVTDEQGRRRFHGAFTGGFSAGYYNTVGTEEGWVPTSFKSSRSSKSGPKVFTAQDYMDDEDLGDFGIAPKTLSTKDDFTSRRKRTGIEEKQLEFREEKLTLPLGSDLIDSLVVPVRSNMGVKLLRNMGWKDGQGLGPHVVRRKKKKKKAPKPDNAAKVYGCRMPGEEDSASDDEYVSKDFKFAPKDQMPVTLKLKNDHHGIGYSGLDPNAALHKKVKKSTGVKAKMQSGSKLSFYGQAFGVGAYEEEDDDIYALDSLTNYDAIMGEEKNPDDTYGWTKPLAITGGPELEAIAFESNPKIIFVPARRQTKLFPRVYPPPNIPSSYDPFRRLKLRTEKQRIDDLNLSKMAAPPMAPPASTDSSRLDADGRRMLLDGEDPSKPDSNTQSVFDFISFEDRRRLEEATRRHPVELGFKRRNEVREEPKEEPTIDRSTPLCNPTLLKPFANDPEKLRRYEQFERAVRQRKRDPYSTIDSNLTEWERKHERDEFSKLSRVYLHLANNINSRFTKESSGADDDGELKEGLNVKETAPASKLKVFGVTTHSTTEWHPDPLLCKRFNVPNPYPDSDLIGSAEQSGMKYLTKLQFATKDPHAAGESEKEAEKIEAPKGGTGIISDTVRPPMFEKARPFVGGRWDKQPEFAGPRNKPPEEETIVSDEEHDAEQAPLERPPMDLFKSIFASSDEESSSSGEDDDASPTKPEQSRSTSSPPTTASERISAADVFLKPLEYEKKSEKHGDEQVLPSTDDQVLPSTEEETPSSHPIDEVTNGVEEGEDDTFGPALPPTRPQTFLAVHSRSPDDDEGRSRKSRSKHKKHKKHDHKSKKKKKKKGKD